MPSSEPAQVRQAPQPVRLNPEVIAIGMKRTSEATPRPPADTTPIYRPKPELEIDAELVEACLPNARRLSGPQYNVFELSGKGYNDLQVANFAGLTMDSLATYKSVIYKKLGIAHLPKLVKRATMVAIYRRGAHPTEKRPTG
jgi:hypothetical protein